VAGIDPTRPGSPADSPAQADVRATAFGLDLHATSALSFLAGSSVEPTGRVLEISIPTAGMASLDWPQSAELLCDERRPDGSVIFRIEAHPQAGYLVSGPEYGAHLLSVDGRQLRCVPDSRSEAAWQRLLIAQVLPFAALLRGLEVFHASAVVMHAKAVAFLGPSRAGKTSLALELCRRGAGFLTDDVLALEFGPDGVLAHPGTPLAGVDNTHAGEEHEPDVGSTEEIVAVNARERILRIRGASNPAPLQTLFFLDRRAEGPGRPYFEPATDTQTLLAATFNFVLASPERLCGLLEVCALAARGRVERVVTGPATSIAQLGDAIERRLSSST